MYTSNQTSANPILNGSLSSNAIGSLTTIPNGMGASGIVVTNGSSGLFSNAMGSNIATTPYPYDDSKSFRSKPTFKMEFYKSENGGFIMSIVKLNKTTYQNEDTLYIIKDVDNMGQEIQNILMLDVLRESYA